MIEERVGLDLALRELRAALAILDASRAGSLIALHVQWAIDLAEEEMAAAPTAAAIASSA